MDKSTDRPPPGTNPGATSERAPNAGSSSAAPVKSSPQPWKLVKFALLVGAGASFGTFVRASLSLAFPHPADGWPWATFLINLAGSFILGLLLESLVLSGTDTGWRRTIRLLCGTGVLGGFTTYSTYVLEVEKLTQAGEPLLGVLYALGSLLLGLVAAGAGIAAAAAVGKRPATAERPGATDVCESRSFTDQESRT